MTAQQQIERLWPSRRDEPTVTSDSAGVIADETRRRGAGRNGLLITDLDNTLYDFPAFFEAGLIGAVEFLSDALRVDDRALLEDFSAVYARVGTIEYSFAMQELASLRRVRADQRRTLAEQAAGVFWTRGSAGLRSYPSVESALRHLASNDVAIVGLTDAPYREVLRRLRFLGLDVYLNRLIAQSDPQRRPASGLGLRLSRVPGYVRGRHRAARRLGLEQRKPSCEVVEEIVSEWSSGPRVAVGDSVQRDLVPAIPFGFACLHATYGARTPDEHPMLMSVVPDILPEVRRGRIGTVPATAEVKPITQFHDVIAHFPIQQQLSLDGLR